MIRRAAFLIALLLLVTASSEPLSAYLKLGSRVGNRTVTLKWETFPIRYFVTNRSAAGVSANEFQAAMGRAFATWQAVDGVSLSSEFVGFTQASPDSGDSLSVLGFVNEPGQDRVLGATSFLIDTTDGEIVEADIFFNSFFPWSVAQGGEAGRFDLESIAVHEVGHLLGLGHSAIGETELRAGGGRRVIAAEAVMFPIAFTAGNTEGRELKPDDIAGIRDIYGTSAGRRETGSISGRITKGGGGVLGAHVTAYNPATGEIVGGFSLSADGSFVIAGLAPGPHILRAEPLDDGDIDSFLDATSEVDVDFRAKFHDKLAVVPRGGGTRGYEIRVVAK
jgi:hypothetical protein